MTFPNCPECAYPMRSRRPLEDVPVEATIQYVDDDELVCGPCVTDVRFGRPQKGLGGLVFDASGKVVERFTAPSREPRVAFFDSNGEMDDDAALDSILDLLDN
jgi:hypothetical protein